MANNQTSKSIFNSNASIVQDWNGGYKLEVDLTAKSAANNWKLDFNLPYTIREVHGVDLTNNGNGSYSINGQNDQKSLQQGQSIKAIFIVDENGQEALVPQFDSSIVDHSVTTPKPTPKPPSEEDATDHVTFGQTMADSVNMPTWSGDVSRPNYNKSEGFFTLDGKLYDANGNEFVARGVNNLHVWLDDNDDNVNQAYDALDNIASFGFNSVRIVWEVDFLDRPTNDDMLEQIIQKTIESGMVPMVEIHDYTGSNDSKALLDQGVKWWTDRAALWEKYEKHLIIDVANEFGDYDMAHKRDRRAFPDIYKEAITRIRNAGIDNTLVIEPFDYAKDYTLIRDYGKEIYNHDPQKNVMFSPHIYAGEGESSETIRDMFDSLTGEKIPFMVGEFADKHPTPWLGGGIADVQEQTIMSEAQEHDIGYFAWAWNNGEFSIASNWEANSMNELSPWGQDLVFNDPNSISATSEIASIFG